MTSDFDPEDGARISAALVRALAEMMAMAEAGDVGGPAFRDLLQHARELHDLLLEQVLAAEPDAADYLRGLCDAMGNKIGDLESITDGTENSPPLH
jgi:hypothetical protein